MQLEEMQQHWQRLDQKLDQLATLGAALAKQVVLQPARRRVLRLAILPGIDIAFSLLLLILGVNFLTSHAHRFDLLFPACVAMIGALTLLIDSMFQLQIISEVDWSGPVASIQATLHRLRIARIRQFKCIILLAPLVGFSAFITALYWLLETLSQGRVDILEKLSAPWVISNYLFGILFIPAGYYLARYLASRCGQHRWWQAILDDIAGNSLQTATSDVQRWATLQQDMHLDQPG